MIVVEKDPVETFNIGMDFAPAIPVGKTITFANVEVTDEADGSNATFLLLASPAATIDGTHAIVRVRNGVDGHSYKVVFTVTLDDGEVVMDGFRLSLKSL